MLNAVKTTIKVGVPHLKNPKSLEYLVLQFAQNFLFLERYGLEFEIFKVGNIVYTNKNLSSHIKNTGLELCELCPFPKQMS